MPGYSQVVSSLPLWEGKKQGIISCCLFCSSKYLSLKMMLAKAKTELKDMGCSRPIPS